MKKKFLFITSGLLASFLAVGALSVGGGKAIFSFAEILNENEWHHYTEVAATESQKGIREYWVQCRGAYQFTAPETGKIVDMTVPPSTDEFAEDDDRYIYPANLTEQTVDLSADTKSLNIGTYQLIGNLGFDDVDLGNNPASLDVSDFPANRSKDGVHTVTAPATSNGKVYQLFIPTTFATKIIRSVADFKTVLPTTTNAVFDVTGRQGAKKGVVGYFVQDADLTIDVTDDMSGLFSWDLLFQATYDGRGHKICAPSVCYGPAGSGYEGGRSQLGVFLNIDGGTIKNLEIHDTCYRGWAGSYIFAKALYNSKIENVTFKIDDTRGSKPGANDGSGAGWLCGGLFMNNKLTNVTIDCAGFDMGVIFARADNVTNSNTFSASRLLCKSFIHISYRHDKDEAYDSPAGLLIESNETIVNWTQDEIDASVSESQKAWASFTTSTNLYTSSNGEYWSIQRANARFATYSYVHFVFPKVNYNDNDYVMFRLATTHGTRTPWFANKDGNYWIKGTPYGPGDETGRYAISEFVIKGGKLYQDGVLVTEIFDSNVLNGTVGFSMQIKLDAAGTESDKGYNNTVSPLICFKAAN